MCAELASALRVDSIDKYYPGEEQGPTPAQPQNDGRAGKDSNRTDETSVSQMGSHYTTFRPPNKKPQAECKLYAEIGKALVRPRTER